MSVDKMHDEKLENRSGSEQLEAGFDEDGKAVRGLMFKMDSRYVFVVFISLLFENRVLTGLLASYPFSRCYSCVRLLIARMSVMRRFSVSKTISVSMITSTPLVSASSTLLILRGELLDRWNLRGSILTSRQ